MLRTCTVWFQPPARAIVLTTKLIKDTLRQVQAQLLDGEINGGKRKLRMDNVCTRDQCGTAACIGGWVSIFLTGYEAEHGANAVFHHLHEFADNNKEGRLYALFYAFDGTKDYNEPNVAATAIQRYLDGKTPWPRGTMPNKMRYRYKRKAK